MPVIVSAPIGRRINGEGVRMANFPKRRHGQTRLFLFGNGMRGVGSDTDVADEVGVGDRR